MFTGLDDLCERASSLIPVELVVRQPKIRLAHLIVHVIMQETLMFWRNSMKVVNFTEARNHLKQVLDQVVVDADYTIISRRDAEDAVVMSLEQFNGLMDTVHLLKSPANAKHLEKSIAQYKAGKAKKRGIVDA